MNAITATVRNRRLEIDVPADWPEGKVVKIEPLQDELFSGMTEEEQGDDVELIARWISTFEAIPPLPMTSAEEADMLAWQQKVEEFNLEAIIALTIGDCTVVTSDGDLSAIPGLAVETWAT